MVAEHGDGNFGMMCPARGTQQGSAAREYRILTAIMMGLLVLLYEHNKGDTTWLRQYWNDKR